MTWHLLRTADTTSSRVRHPRTHSPPARQPSQPKLQSDFGTWGQPKPRCEIPRFRRRERFRSEGPAGTLRPSGVQRSCDQACPDRYRSDAPPCRLRSSHSPVPSSKNTRKCNLFSHHNNSAISHYCFGYRIIEPTNSFEMHFFALCSDPASMVPVFQGNHFPQWTIIPNTIAGCPSVKLSTGTDRFSFAERIPARHAD